MRVNPAFEKCLGRPEATVLGLPIINIMALDDLPAHTNMPRLLRYGGGLVEVNLIAYKYRVTDNGKRWYLILRPC